MPGRYDFEADGQKIIQGAPWPVVWTFTSNGSALPLQGGSYTMIFKQHPGDCNSDALVTLTLGDGLSFVTDGSDGKLSSPLTAVQTATIDRPIWYVFIGTTGAGVELSFIGRIGVYEWGPC